MNKKASFFLSVEQRDNHDAAIYNYFPAVLGSRHRCLRSITSTSVFRGAVQIRTTTSTFRRASICSWDRRTRSPCATSSITTPSRATSDTTQLPSQSVSSNSKEHTFQLSDSQIINDRMVNETRFEYRRALEIRHTRQHSARRLVVSGNFTGGGASSQSSNDHQDHFELQNFTTMSAGSACHQVRRMAARQSRRQLIVRESQRHADVFVEPATSTR